MRLPWQQRPPRRWPAQDTGGQKAREEAERALEQTRAQTPQFAELGRELREIRQRNHLAEAFLKAAGGKS